MGISQVKANAQERYTWVWSATFASFRLGLNRAQVDRLIRARSTTPHSKTNHPVNAHPANAARGARTKTIQNRALLAKVPRNLRAAVPPILGYERPVDQTGLWAGIWS